MLLINAKPNRPATLVFSWLLFAAGIAAYLWVAGARHRENPEERVTPTVEQMASHTWIHRFTTNSLVLSSIHSTPW